MKMFYCISYKLYCLLLDFFILIKMIILKNENTAFTFFSGPLLCIFNYDLELS